MRFSLLGSGSSGNAMIVASGSTKVLIDCGLSFRQLALRAEAVGESLDDLDAIFITHEHGDHVNGLPVLSRKLRIPIYMSHGTAGNLSESLGPIEGVTCFDPGDSVTVRDLHLQSFSIQHDAADPVNFVVSNGQSRIGLATDMGRANDWVRRCLNGCHALVLESNYCPDMLRNSPYPASIRQRIASPHGHLSNPDMNSLLSDLLHDALRLVVLVHISRENNDAVKARGLAARVLRGHGAQLVVAEQDRPTPLFRLDQTTLPASAAASASAAV